MPRVDTALEPALMPTAHAGPLTTLPRLFAAATGMSVRGHHTNTTRHHHHNW